MRTDRASNCTHGVGPPLSRRSFLLGGGTVAGVAVGTDGGANERTARGIDVGATEPYLPGLRAAAENYERSPVAVGPADEFGDADVLVSGRPTESEAEGLYATTNGPIALIDGWAVLSTPEDEWRECLPPGAVRNLWASDVPVESWSEADPGHADGTPGTDLPATRRSDATSLILVRGTRADQYARGHGGIGYYSVSPSAIRGPSEYGEENSNTPVARLGFVHADREVFADERVSDFFDHYGRRTDEVEHSQ